jgi:predicted Zn-dependent peptidase
MTNYRRNVSFTTTAPTQDILTLTNVKAIIKEALYGDGITATDAEVLARLKTTAINFTIYTSSTTTISLNDGIYNALILESSSENAMGIYSSGDYLIGLESIKITDSSTTGVLSFIIK